MDTRAYANHAADKPFVPYSFVRRSPGPNDVAIDIKFCGICHSDIHTARSEWGEAHYPCVPGHEIIGTVQAIGSDVSGFSVGQSVGVGCLVGSCGSCGSCNDGLEQYCENGFVGTYNSDLPDGDYTKGGYSSHIVVDQRFVLSVPKGLDPAAVAPLLCAGITTYSPLKHLGIGKGHSVAVLGNRIFAAGGLEGGGTMECYDPVSNTWRDVANMNTSTYLFGLGVVRDCLFAVGGIRRDGSVEKYPQTLSGRFICSSRPT